jgi:hypothetical protein
MKLNLLLLSVAALANAANGANTEPAVELGRAEEFVILAKTGISTVPASSISGNIGVSPIDATAITGFNLKMDSGGEFSTAKQIVGRAYAADYAAPIPTELTDAVSDMETAYANAAERPNEDDERINIGKDDIKGDLSGMSLTPGVYTFGVDISFSEDISFDGGPDDVFIIQTTGNLLQAEGTQVILENDGVQAKNIFWQVGGEVKVGAGSILKGVLLVKTNALFMAGSSLDGRVFAQTACDLRKASITEY